VRQSKKWVESLGFELGAVPKGMETAWRKVPSIEPLTSSIGAEMPKMKKSPSEASNHVFLGCSSLDELDWVNKEAAPFLQRHEVAYSTVLACDSVPPESRMILLKKGSRAFRQVLYHIPSTKTFLSGMVEIAYLLGHSDWQVTLCVSKEAELLEAQNDREDEVERAARRRRNDCYAIAFCYLKDMAKRHQCRVFSDIDESLHHCVKLSQSGGC
ncbi:unnamed protein product, partial [Mesorhabditis belari]